MQNANLIHLFDCRLKMLAKVEYGGVQKYIKVPQTDDNFHFLQFLQEGLCNSNKGIIIAQIAILIMDEVA